MSEKTDPEISPSPDGDSINRIACEPGVKIPKQEKYDPWDLDAARNRQKKERRVKVVTVYRVASRPRMGSFIRVHPDPAYQIDSLLYVAKDERGIDSETYFVDWGFADEVVSSEWSMFFRPARLYLAIERHASKPYVHYVRYAREGEKDNDWWQSGRSVVERAMKEWVQPFNAGGNYDFHPAMRPIPDPEWPDTPFGEILRIAFKGRLIDSWDHEVMKALVGA